MVAYASTLRMWSTKHQLEACRDCGRSNVKHFAAGQCSTCYQREHYGRGFIWARRGTYWSEKHRLNACRSCGESERPHRARGLCHRCHAQQPDQVEKQRAFHNPERTRRYNLKKNYGLSLDDYDALVEAQNGGCAICGCPPDRHGCFNVDHDHKSGKVRGLLCERCNKGIGLFDDEPKKLEAAIKYILEDIR